MKAIKISTLSIVILTMALIISAFQQAEPRTKQQLLEPADLAKTLNDSKSPQPIVYSVGPQAIIKNSIDIGPGKEKDNLKKLKEQLSKLPKNVDIVIYCGRCPFDKCPNIRPEFQLLNDMKFTNQKLLSLQTNVKVDWFNKGYPVSQ